MTTNPLHKARASRLGMIAGMAFALTGAAMPAIAQNVPWVVETVPSRTPVETCKAVINQTARGAVQRCLGKVGVVIAFDDFVATAAPVCKTTHVATTIENNVTRVGYIYSNKLSAIMRPACG